MGPLCPLVGSTFGEGLLWQVVTSFAARGFLVSIAGFVLGIIAVVFAFIPVFGAFIAIPCALVGLPLSITGFFRDKKQGHGFGTAVAGIVTCAVAPVIAVVFMVVIFVAVDEAIDDISTDPQRTIEEFSDSLANDDGRSFMRSQPCADVMAEYNAMKIAGHDAAVMHVSNVYNIKTGIDPYIAVSDANARIKECN